MTLDPRALGRYSLWCAGAMLALVGLGMIDDPPGAWAQGAVTLLRFGLAGAAVPPVLLPLVRSDPPPSRLALAFAAAGLAWGAVMSFPILTPVMLPLLLLAAALASERFHRLGMALLFVGYAVCMVLRVVSRVAGLYLPDPWEPAMLAGLALFALVPLIVLWALCSPKSWRRWGIAVPALLFAMFLPELPLDPLTHLSDTRYLQRRDLNEFAERVQGYSRIDQMWEPEPEWRWLNGTRVTATRAEADSLREHRKDPVLVLPNVLARDSIDPAVHADFSRKLRRFHFVRLDRAGDYVVYARTNRTRDLVHARRGAPLMRPGEKVPGSGVVVGERIGQWYFAH